MDLAKPESVSLGQSGANIGMVIGRPIEAEGQMGLETYGYKPMRNLND